MKIAAQFMPGDLPVFLDSVRKAEESGYSRVYLVDGQLLWRNVFVYMTHGLAATERIPFGTAVTNPSTRHFSVLANAHATLEEIHPGRVILGIGRGDNAVRTLGKSQVATSRMRDVVPMLRDLMAGKPVRADGHELRMLWAGQPDVPILMAASGPRNLRLAGALADVVMMQVGVHPAACRWGVEHVRAGAEAAGRDPAEVEITLYTAMVVSDDLDWARGQTKWAAACARNHLTDVARRVPDHGMPEPIMRLVEMPESDYDYAGHLDPSVERGAYPTEVVDDFGFAGPPERIVEMLQALAEVGVDEVAPCYLNGRLEEMEIVGREIVPAVAALRA
jgi:alkanesulfonate monooxygenase SsuD/methylene tetrahydromethanopterin reductase-like flavin-dependent oxidoreductase (luciferase family)